MMKKNSRVAFILPSGTMGGAEQILFTIANNLRQTKEYCIDVFLLTGASNGSWEKLAGPTVHLMRFNAERERTGFLLYTAYWLRNVFRPRRYDLVFTSHVHTTAITGLLRTFGLFRADRHVARESTVIFRRFSGLKRAMFKAMYRAGYRKLSLLICQTPRMKAELLEEMAWLANATRIKVLPNPIDLFKINESLLESPGLPEDVLHAYPFIVTAGRLIPVKGFDQLVIAFATVIKHFPGLHLVIMGSGPDEPELRRLAARLNLSNKIHFTGWKDNPMPYFKHAELCVISSIIEGFPNTLLQMLSCNDKVVSTRCTDTIKDIPVIGQCEPNDPAGLADAIVTLLRNPAHTRSSIQQFLEGRSVTSYIQKIQEEIYQR